MPQPGLCPSPRLSKVEKWGPLSTRGQAEECPGQRGKAEGAARVSGVVRTVTKHSSPGKLLQALAPASPSASGESGPVTSPAFNATWWLRHRAREGPGRHPVGRAHCLGLGLQGRQPRSSLPSEPASSIPKKGVVPEREEPLTGS